MTLQNDLTLKYQKMNKKIIVLGYARHGKDTVCEILHTKYNFSFPLNGGTSLFIAEKVIMPLLAEKYGYKTAEECFKDRINHRAEWFDIIHDFNKDDVTKLCRLVLSQFDIYCGLRSKEELEHLLKEEENIITVWVDRSKHVRREPAESITIDMSMADYVIDNNGNREDLEREVEKFVAHYTSSQSQKLLSDEDLLEFKMR